ncbi:hypothetical protein M5K25_002503 [Dendrobium thyrsiflorum]|uniref:CCHC-type domain-containing protein n=1 Tax=Dendrobium thyrsiflorum TaxID=117978 RepID=A0ABD0VUS6_DENTH
MKYWCGLWYVGGRIVGMDKWSPSFAPDSFKGLTAPVWIRFPCLPLYCWDEENISRIASRIGAPMYLDGNSFKWGRREFARACIRINLENKLPSGIWVDGISGRFFQKVEYEKIDLLCFHCGRIGHDKSVCPEDASLVQSKQPVKRRDDAQVAQDGINSSVQHDEYGPWIHVKFKNNRFRNGRLAPGGGTSSSLKADKQVKAAIREDGVNVAGLSKLHEETQQLPAEVVGGPKLSEGVSADVALKKDGFVSNKFNVLANDIEDGEVVVTLVERTLKEQLEVSYPESLPSVVDKSRGGEAVVLCGSMVKSRGARELKSLGPVEADHRKRRGDGFCGDFSPLVA